jgi:two-component system, NarL family, sensor kinase
LVFLCVPFLIWAACRFGQRLAITSVFVLSKIAVWGTLSGSGPFVRQTQNESLLFLQIFAGVASVMTMALAAVVSELRKARGELELKVEQRTQDLSQAVQALQLEVTERKNAESAVRQLSGRLLQTQDEERRRIARDLHDSTGQKVAALAIDLAAVGEGAAALPPRARKAFSECLNLSQQIASEVRTLSYLLHPPLLDEIGLAPAIRWYADGIVQRGSLQMDLNIPHNLGRLPREAEMALFRVVQESLTNILLHSGSKRAKISIIHDAGEVRLEVSDEGRGIPPGILDHSNGDGKRPGVGIVSMLERMKQLGGRLEINSDGTGTVIRAVLPVGGES